MGGDQYKQITVATTPLPGEVPDPASKSPSGRRGVKRRHAARIRLYHGGKISDVRFKAILYCFARDLTATEAAAETGLSLNSTAALYRNLRAYFMGAKLFLRQDVVTGVETIDELADPGFLRSVHAFHDNRMRRQRGVTAEPDQADHRLAESWWRYDFAMMLRKRFRLLLSAPGTP